MSSKVLFKAVLISVCFCLVYAYGENLVTNPDFEDGTSGWSSRGCSIESIDSPVHSGSGAAKVFDRTEGWQGIKQDMVDKMKDGKTYKVSVWAKLADAGSETVIISFEQHDDNGTNYHNAARASVTDSEWVEISGEFNLQVSGTLSVLDIYLEGPDAGVSFYIDDASVTEVGSEKSESVLLTSTSTFEEMSACSKKCDPNTPKKNDPNDSGGCKK